MRRLFCAIRGSLQTLVVPGVLLVLGAIPLAVAIWPPAMDGSEHVAIVEVLVRLWRQLPEGQQQPYVLHLQPLGYHLFFAVTTPLACLVGAVAAVKTVVWLLMLAHVGGCALWLARRGLPTVLAAGGLLSFYSHHFTYGFYPTLMGTPPVLWLIAELCCPLRPARRSFGRAVCLAVVGALCALGHVVFAPLVVLTALSAWLWHGSRVRSDALAAALGVACPLVPALLALGRRALFAPADVSAAWQFDSLKQGLSHLNKATYAIDKHAAMLGTWLLLGTCLLLALWGARRSPTPLRRTLGCLATVLVACVSAVWWIPYGTPARLGTSLLLNVRWLAVVPWLMVLLLSQIWSQLRRPLRATGAVALLISAGLVSFGATRLTLMFAREADHFMAAAEHIPQGARMCSYDEPVDLGESWPKVRFNLSTMAFSPYLSSHSGLFIGNHLPIDELQHGEQQRAKQSTQAFFVAWQAQQVAEAEAEALWQACDVAFFQHPDVGELAQLSRGLGKQLGSGRGWRLIARPTASQASAAVVP